MRVRVRVRVGVRVRVRVRVGVRVRGHLSHRGVRIVRCQTHMPHTGQKYCMHPRGTLKMQWLGPLGCSGWSPTRRLPLKVSNSLLPFTHKHSSI